jgi:hypothetical protein
MGLVQITTEFTSKIDAYTRQWKIVETLDDD